MDRKDPVRADPVTKVIAQRVAELRNGQRLSGAALSKRVKDLGVKSWSDSTISKLETGRRESVTVSELLALAIALRVSPVELLAEPRDGRPLPAAEDVELDSWSALYWLVGLGAPEPAGYGERVGRRFLRDALAFEALIADFPSGPARARQGEDDERRAKAEAEYVTSLLAQISDALRTFTEVYEVVAPPLPARVLAAARRYDVELPGVDQGGAW